MKLLITENQQNKLKKKILDSFEKTTCHNGEINGEPSEGYDGDMLVKKIQMGGGKHNYFLVHGLDEEGKYVEFATDNLTFNVGDSIHVDFSKGEVYPLDDKENIGKF